LSYVQADLIREALATLGALDASNTPAAEDSAKVTARLADITADLVARRITGAVNLTAIADDVFSDLVVIVAERLAPQFGRPTAEDILKLAEGRLAHSYRLSTVPSALVRAVLERLDVLGASSNAYHAAAVDGAIARTLADLTARRIVSIANEAAVTPAMFWHVVTLIAADCVPGKVDRVAAEGTLSALARLVRDATPTLGQRVLEQLVVWGASSAFDLTAIDARLPGVLANLAARNVIYISDVDSVPDAWLDPLVRYTAGLFAGPQIAGEYATQAERELRTLARINSGTGGMLGIDAALKVRRGPGRFDFARGH
jgi:hypothetical protein